MKLPKNAIIEREKLTQYLLVPKKRNDKSKWLAQAGYTIGNWQVLENDLRVLLVSSDATFIEETVYGKMYKIIGNLLGPAGKVLSVDTIWMIEGATKKTKFITMYPYKQIGRIK
ncbi:MAG: DUF6883 domain-containing protein [Candidatus Omnitrophota bacterium]